MLRQQDNNAFAVYDFIINLVPNHPDAYNAKAWLLNKINRSEEALQLAEVAVRLDPDNANLLDTKGWILYTVGNYSESLQLFERSLKKDAVGEVWYHKGHALQKLGRTGEAEQCFGKARELGYNN